MQKHDLDVEMKSISKEVHVLKFKKVSVQFDSCLINTELKLKIGISHLPANWTTTPIEIGRKDYFSTKKKLKSDPRAAVN